MVDLFAFEDTLNCHCYQTLNVSEFLLGLRLIFFNVLCALFEFFLHFYQFSHSSIQSFGYF